MNEIDRMDMFLIVFSTVVALFLIIMMFLKLIRGVKSNEYVDNQIIKFKKASSRASLVSALVFGFQLYLRYKMDRNIYELVKEDMHIESFIEFIFTLDIAPMIMYIFSAVIIIISIIDFIIGLIFKVGIFEDGIVVEEGVFIPWNSIKKVESENAMSEKYKVLVIYTNKIEKRKIFKIPHRVKIRVDEFEKAIDIMKNKMKIT